MDSKFKVLFYHSEIRWLFWEKVTKGCLLAKLFKFLKDHKHRRSKHFKESRFILTLTYLVNIFGTLNYLNFQMQRDRVNVIEAKEKMSVLG